MHFLGFSLDRRAPNQFLRENNMLNLIKHSEVDKISNKAVMLYIEVQFICYLFIGIMLVPPDLC